jgi:alpha-beta hydrolase superfamily lysophospholipase
VDIIVRNRRVKDIPVLELYRTDEPGKRPMVLLYHGYMGRKEFILPQAYLLAANGFYVVAPDAAGHGERSGTRIIDLLEAITKSEAEINQLLDHFADHETADASRVGLAGYSMGGCITFAYLVGGEKRINAAVPIISTPDWVSIVDGIVSRGMTEELKSYGIIEKEEDLKEFRNLAEKIQPINYYQEMKDIPLLMLCGEKDELTPAQGVIRLYEKLKPLTRNKEALCYRIYPGVGHADTVEMNMEMAEWFKKYI